MLIAAPVCAGAGGQLERLDLGRIGAVRACAQVGEVALMIQRNQLAFRQILNQLYLIRLILLAEQVERILAGNLLANHRNALLDDFFHLRLDLFQILRREIVFGINIVIEAVVDGRSDCQLDIRIQVLDCLCQNVRSGVTQGPLAHIIIKGQDAHRAVLLQRGFQIDGLSVYLCCQCGACQTGRNLLGNIQTGCTILDLHDGSVFQGNVNHNNPILSLGQKNNSRPQNVVRGES